MKAHILEILFFQFVALSIVLSGCGAKAPKAGKAVATEEVSAPAGSKACSTDAECTNDALCEDGLCSEAPILESIRQGNVSLAAMRVALRQDSCVPMPGLRRILTALHSDPMARTKWMEQLRKIEPSAGDGAVAYGEWLRQVATYFDRCDVDEDLSDISEEAAPATEQEIDIAIKQSECEVLRRLHRLRMWPFEGRFAKEVMDRNFSAAEVTRLVWLDTLREYEKHCSKRFTRREVMEIHVHEEKLERIIGLNDETLVNLRSRLLSALEAENADAVLSYSRAISEREKVLDSRNASVYEERLRAIETNMIAKNESAKKTDSKRKGKKKEKDGLETAAQTIETVDKSIDTVNKGVDTTRKIMGMFGL
ncbi:MAG: hypothetical protein GY854_24575 [Deltaproteobacteria bacterium]|nr:hypothetical protein [Deltaproteobacteria bacterium]